MNLFKRIKVAAKLIFNRLDAARHDISRSYRHAPTQDARFDVTQSERNVIVGKARDFEANNPTAQKLGSVFVDYVVGANGLPVMPASSDLEWNKRAKAYFSNTAQFIDLCSRQNFGVLQGQIAWRWFFDGEIFILKTRGQAADGKWFPRIQLIESHLIGTPPSLAKEEGKTIIDGVVIDKNGRPTGYWKKESSKSDQWRLIDAKDIIHVFEPSRPGEYRGLTFLHAVMNLLHDLDDIQKLEMQCAKRNAVDAVIIETATGEADMEESIRSGGESTGSDGKIRKSHYEDVFGASARYMFQGDKVHQNPGERPSATTIEHWNVVMSQICMGVGISKQLVYPYSIQGTIGRFDIDSCAVFFRSRSAVIQAAVREIFIYVVGWGIRAEKTLADPPFDWTSVSIRPPQAPNADIGYKTNAVISMLEAGGTNFDLMYGPLGLDWQEEVTKLADQRKFIKELAASRGLEVAEIIHDATAVLKARGDAMKTETENQAKEEADA